MDQNPRDSAALDRILRLAANKEQPSTDREIREQLATDTGLAALGLLQQAAQEIKARETRAHSLAQRAVDDLAAASERIRSLEARVVHAEARAKEAEKWLIRLHQSIQETLTDWQGDQFRDSTRSSAAA